MQHPIVELSRGLYNRRVCWSCLCKISRTASRPPLRRGRISPYTTIAARTPSPIITKNYFFGNEVRKRGGFAAANAVESSRATPSPTTSTPRTTIAIGDFKPAQAGPLPPENDVTLPHRRRRRKYGEDDPHELPPDASSQYSDQAASHASQSLRQRFFTYLSLSKPRLTFLMVLTTTTAYSLFPVAITPLSTSMSLSPLTLLNLTAGTALSSACANALNMLMEPTHDAKMTRTRTRPLVRGLITPRAAMVFAVACGTSGVALLNYGVNPTVAFLSALNIFLYAGIYTPMKRLHVANTWAGAVVGGIPPLMGWAAAAGQASMNPEAGWRDFLFDPAVSTGGWLLAALLFAWQFPHFNAIAYTIRHEYANAGYKMLASVNVPKNGLIALRYSLVMVPICAGLCYTGVTGWGFLATSSVVNGWLIRDAWRFWRQNGGKGSARGLFWASVWQLPLVLVLAMVHKSGLWERFFKGGFEDDEEMLEYVREESHEEEVEGELLLKDRVA